MFRGVLSSVYKWYIGTQNGTRERRGRDRTAVGFLTTNVIGAYHH